MSTLYPLTQSQTLSNLRVDLSDTDPSAPYRFADTDLLRAIDKSLERYSWANPWIQIQQIPTIAGSPIYASPSGSWFIDRVEYPAGRYPKNFPPFLERKSPLIPAPVAPSQPTQLAFTGGGGGIAIGTYSYAFTYVVPGLGETPTGATIANRSNAFASASALHNGIPIGPYGVSGRNIYRSDLTGSLNTLKLCGQIADNLTTTFTDTIADGQRGGAAPATNTTQNLDQFELQIPPELYPSDATTYYIEVSYATKHQLDANGTTVPERHWDVLYLGGVAYAMAAYLPQVNDNFEYADGHLRDRVDDTKSTVAWQTQCQAALRDLDNRLKQVKEEANAAIAATTHWGDVPLRWDRL